MHSFWLDPYSLSWNCKLFKIILRSRDWQGINGNWIFLTTIHTLKLVLVEKNWLKYMDSTYYNNTITILNEVKIWIVKPVDNFKISKIHLHFVCQPASQPAVRPTSARSMGPVFSVNAEYQCATTDLLFQFWFICCAMLVPLSFVVSLSLWLIIEEVRNHVSGVDKLLWLLLIMSLKWLNAHGLFWFYTF